MSTYIESLVRETHSPLSRLGFPQEQTSASLEAAPPLTARVGRPACHCSSVVGWPSSCDAFVDGAPRDTNITFVHSLIDVCPARPGAPSPAAAVADSTSGRSSQAAVARLLLSHGQVEASGGVRSLSPTLCFPADATRRSFSVATSCAAIDKMTE